MTGQRPAAAQDRHPAWDERAHRLSGADHAPQWEAASTIDGKACRTCREQSEQRDARPAWVRRAQGDGAGVLPPKVYR